MSKKEAFVELIQEGYTFKGGSIPVGAAVLDGECFQDAAVSIPLRTLNRHGLIAGATGTGKTKSLQMLAEQLSKNGVPSLLMDVKGDLSGIAVGGEHNEKIESRHQQIGIEWESMGCPVEFLSLSTEKGARLRATVSEFGPVLFSKMLGLNETQGGAMAIVFKYCDDNGLPLLDLKDIKKVLQYIMNDAADQLKAEYGLITSTTMGSIMRKIVELEQQGADVFFGEKSFEVDDLCQVDENGYGKVHVVRLADVQDRPKLFSTFMLQLLAEIYSTFPEEGDLEQPKLTLFIDEAHLIFQESSTALLQQIETIIKLIRSKGVGIFFITQNPADVPESVLGQLGLKIQHALRAFTAKDRKSIKEAAQNYPETEFYKTEDLLTTLGIGEAFVTALNEKGIPTPLVHCMMRAPESRMDVLTSDELDEIVDNSSLVRKYNQEVDRESAYEILNQKMESVATTEPTEEEAPKSKEKGFFDTVLNNTVTRQVGRTLARELTRGILGVLGVGGKRRGGGLFG